MKRVIHGIDVHEWPLTKVGQEYFFGYVVAIGLMLEVETGDKVVSYADFAYGGRYRRFQIPEDPPLIKALLHYLKANLYGEQWAFAKVWIKRNESGYEVYLP